MSKTSLLFHICIIMCIFLLCGCSVFTTAVDAYDSLRERRDTVVYIHRIDLPDTVRVKIITGE